MRKKCQTLSLNSVYAIDPSVLPCLILEMTNLSILLVITMLKSKQERNGNIFRADSNNIYLTSCHLIDKFRLCFHHLKYD